MQIYYYEPNNEIFESVSRGLIDQGAEVTRVGEEFFEPDAAKYSLRVNETRSVLIGHEDNNEQRSCLKTLKFIRTMRNSGVNNPIIVQRFHPNAEENVSLLNCGADDVVVRPVKAVELFARFNVAIRRFYGHNSSSVKIGAITVFFDGRDPEVVDPRNPDAPVTKIKLTQREHTMFCQLAMRPGQIVEKRSLFDGMYADLDRSPLDKVIDVFICKLRKKIKKATGDEGYIVTSYGRGYLLQAPDDASKTNSGLQIADQSRETLALEDKSDDLVILQAFAGTAAEVSEYEGARD